MYFLLFCFGHETLYGVVFRHDNARPHAARHNTQFLANSYVQIYPWPPLSPDFNPNKLSMNKLERRVRGRVNAPANVRELFQALKQEWVAIPTKVIHNLIQTVPERCWAVIDSREDTPPTDGNATQSQNTEWLNLFMDEECYQFKKKYELDF